MSINKKRHIYPLYSVARSQILCPARTILKSSVRLQTKLYSTQLKNKLHVFIRIMLIQVWLIGYCPKKKVLVKVVYVELNWWHHCRTQGMWIHAVMGTSNWGVHTLNIPFLYWYLSLCIHHPPFLQILSPKWENQKFQQSPKSQCRNDCYVDPHLKIKKITVSIHLLSSLQTCYKTIVVRYM